MCVCVCCVLISERKSIIRKWLCDKAVSLFVFYIDEDFFTEKLNSLFLFYFFLAQTFCFAGFLSDSKSHTSRVFFFIPFWQLLKLLWSTKSQSAACCILQPRSKYKEWKHSRKSGNNSKRKRQAVEPVWPARLHPSEPSEPSEPPEPVNGSAWWYLWVSLSVPAECSPLFFHILPPTRSYTHTHTRTRTLSHTLYSHPSFLSSVPLHAHIQI